MAPGHVRTLSLVPSEQVKGPLQIMRNVIPRHRLAVTLLTRIRPKTIFHILAMPGILKLQTAMKPHPPP